MEGEVYKWMGRASAWWPGNRDGAFNASRQPDITHGTNNELLRTCGGVASTGAVNFAVDESPPRKLAPRSITVLARRATTVRPSWAQPAPAT